MVQIIETHCINYVYYFHKILQTAGSTVTINVNVTIKFLSEIKVLVTEPRDRILCDIIPTGSDKFVK